MFLRSKIALLSVIMICPINYSQAAERNSMYDSDAEFMSSGRRAGYSREELEETMMSVDFILDPASAIKKYPHRIYDFFKIAIESGLKARLQFLLDNYPEVLNSPEKIIETLMVAIKHRKDSPFSLINDYAFSAIFNKYVKSKRQFMAFPTLVMNLFDLSAEMGNQEAFDYMKNKIKTYKLSPDRLKSIYLQAYGALKSSNPELAQQFLAKDIATIVEIDYRRIFRPLDLIGAIELNDNEALDRLLQKHSELPQSTENILESLAVAADGDYKVAFSRIFNDFVKDKPLFMDSPKLVIKLFILSAQMGNKEAFVYLKNRIEKLNLTPDGRKFFYLKAYDLLTRSNPALAQQFLAEDIAAG